MSSCGCGTSTWPTARRGLPSGRSATRRSSSPSRVTAEVVLLFFAATFGYLMDSLLVLAGVIEFPHQARLGLPSTLWMVALWINLATTLNASLGWLRGRYVLGAVMGLVAGPLSYFAGVRLGAISFGLPTGISLAVIAVEWALSMPALLVIAALTSSRPTQRDEKPSAAAMTPAEARA
ncbi:MAG: DUF2878 domain-containing protein [Planctomycetota bacterium]